MGHLLIAMTSNISVIMKQCCACVVLLCMQSLGISCRMTYSVCINLKRDG